MKSFKISKNNSTLMIVFVLLVSLLINVYTLVINSKYKLLIGKETYKSVEEIRNRNESALTTLEPCIKSKSISNEELLSLYKNYSSISKELTKLCLEYKDYNQKEIIMINKRSKNSYEVPTEVYSRIESLLFEHLNYEMKTNNEKVILDGEVLENFTALYELSNKINNFYKEFNETKLKNIDIDKREVIYIRKTYWIDILNGIKSVIEPYSNYEFTFKE